MRNNSLTVINEKPARPFRWRVVRLLVGLIAACIVLYTGLAIYFFMGEPSVSVNYVEQMNAPAMQAKPEQLAWPIYREAVILLNYHGQESSMDDILSAVPGGLHWSELVEWLGARKDAIELIREASQKPVFGFIYGDGGSARDPGLWPSNSAANPVDGPEPLISIRLSYVQELKTLGRVLAADTRLALTQSDAPRIRRNLDAQLGIAGHLQREAFLINGLVEIRVMSGVLTELQAILSDSPQLLSNDDLSQIARALNGPQTADGLITYKTERMLFYDCVQRAYTDNGRGGGRLTPAGIRAFAQWTDMSNNGGPRANPLLLALAPAMVVMSAGRDNVVHEYNRLMDLADANLRVPLRDATWASFDNGLVALRDSMFGKIRYLPIMMCLPSLSRSQTTAEQYLGHRDGMVVGIALELYRREHGRYPRSLGELAQPLPVDRITGGPLLYRLVDDKPMVYSVGADRDDDGGRPAPTRAAPDPDEAAQWNIPGTSAPDGDWVLYACVDVKPGASP